MCQIPASFSLLKKVGKRRMVYSYTDIMRYTQFIATLLFAVALGAPVYADDVNIFVNKCGQCHRKAGEAKPINPADKAGIVWHKYFKRQRHPVALDALISEAEMVAILAYLQDHAADSEQPVAAAIPQ